MYIAVLQFYKLSLFLNCNQIIACMTREDRLNGDFTLDIKNMEFGSGVYFLYNKGELVYIGKATNITRRIVDHVEEGTKEFDTVRYTKIPVDSITSVETELIKSLDPPYNKTCKASSSKYKDNISASKITISPVVLMHQKNRNGEYHVCIRVSYKGKSFYLRTNLVAYDEDVEKGRILNEEIVKDARKLIKPLYNASKFISCDMSFDYVKNKLTATMKK